MMFIVQCPDNDGVIELRRSIYEDHREHLLRADQYGVEIKMAGPIVDEENEELVLGSCMLLTADSKKDIERFNEQDPYRLNGVWKEVTIQRFKGKTF